MKSLSKRYSKGRGLVKSAVFVSFVFMMVFVTMALARGEPADASGSKNAFQAFCWEDREKFFKLLDTSI